MKRLLIILTLTIGLAKPLHAQEKFNWTDTTLSAGQTRTIQLMRAFNGSCDLKPCYDYGGNKQTYDTLVSFLKANKEISLAFLWHTWTYDDSGFNLHISKRMADGLIKELIRQGIEEKRISAIGLGESKPLVSENELQRIHDSKKRNEADRRNWRIEVVVTSAPNKS
jgi:outer membrane protein OmpA-like peptidoglycan-associated protein